MSYAVELYPDGFYVVDPSGKRVAGVFRARFKAQHEADGRNAAIAPQDALFTAPQTTPGQMVLPS